MTRGTNVITTAVLEDIQSFYDTVAEEVATITNQVN